MSDDDKPGVDELPRARDAYRYIADRRVLDPIARIEREAPKMLHPVGVPLYLREQKTHVEPADWRTGFLGQNDHEYEIHHQLISDIHTNTPQALLRDLFRPERESFVWYDREVQVRLDRGGVEALREARAALKRDPLPTIAPLSIDVAAAQERRRALLRTRWEPRYRDDEARPEVSVYHDPSLL